MPEDLPKANDQDKANTQTAATNSSSTSGEVPATTPKADADGTGELSKDSTPKGAKQMDSTEPARAKTFLHNTGLAHHPCPVPVVSEDGTSSAPGLHYGDGTVVVVPEGETPGVQTSKNDLGRGGV